MSGLEVVGIVAGIVSAYTGAATVYQKWREQRKERKKKEENRRLKRLVTTSGPAIKQEYDRDFQRLGHVFARGDNIGQMALMGQLITLQESVIALLSSNAGLKNPLSAVIHPNHDQIFSTSNTVRANTLSALGEQFQRLSQAARIADSLRDPDPSPEVKQQHAHPEAPRSTPSSNEAVPDPPVVLEAIQSVASLEAATDQNSPSQTVHGGCSGRFYNSRTERPGRAPEFTLQCSSCGWSRDNTNSSCATFFYKTKDGRTHLKDHMARKFHYVAVVDGRRVSRFRCFICPGGLEFGEMEDLGEHVEEFHTWEEIRDKKGVS